MNELRLDLLRLALERWGGAGIDAVIRAAERMAAFLENELPSSISVDALEKALMVAYRRQAAERKTAVPPAAPDHAATDAAPALLARAGPPADEAGAAPPQPPKQHRKVEWTPERRAAQAERMRAQQADRGLRKQQNVADAAGPGAVAQGKSPGLPQRAVEPSRPAAAPATPAPKATPAPPADARSDEVAKFIAERGITRVPAGYAAKTSAARRP